MTSLISPKEEPSADWGPVDLESRILELCITFPDGISEPDLQAQTTWINKEQRIAAINRLLSTGKIELKQLGNTLLYKLKSQESLDKIKGATKEETLIYQLIEDAKNKGIWIQDIRKLSNLPNAQLDKILKSLESRKLVKSIRPVEAQRKKVYMLYDLEPEATLKGGSFWSEQEFDVQFVDLLNQQCLKFLRSRAVVAKEKFPSDLLARKQSSWVSSMQICQHIRDLQISKIELNPKEVEQILDTLVYDGTAQKQKDGAERSSYRAVDPPLSHCGLVKVPCAFCPVLRDCKPGGVISPSTCSYFKDWLGEI